MTKIVGLMASDIRDEFREACLSAMDAALGRIATRFDRRPTRNDVGAIDADLPVLFKALDAQLDRALARLNIELDEYDEVVA